MTEILLIGTFHYPDRFDIFSENIQQQIELFTEELMKFHPTKIAVEFPYKMQDKLNSLYEKCNDSDFGREVVLGEVQRYGKVGSFSSVNEIVQIGFRLGKKLHQKKIYGIDEDIEMSDELFAKIVLHLNINPYTETMQHMHEKVRDLKELYAVHNSKEYNNLDHNIYLNANKINLGNYEGSQLTLQWYERNLKIFSNLQNICESDDRVLLLIGSSHLTILRELVNGSDKMKLASF